MWSTCSMKSISTIRGREASGSASRTPACPDRCSFAVSGSSEKRKVKVEVEVEVKVKRRKFMLAPHMLGWLFVSLSLSLSLSLAAEGDRATHESDHAEDV